MLRVMKLALIFLSCNLSTNTNYFNMRVYKMVSKSLSNQHSKIVSYWTSLYSHESFVSTIIYTDYDNQYTYV